MRKATIMLPPFKPASDFVPPGLDATRWESLEPLYRTLQERTLKCAGCLETLILDRGELDAAVSEASATLHINMTCHTDDPAANKAYVDFIEQVEPRLKQAGDALDRKIAQSPFVGDLDAARYAVYLRNLRLGIELFRPESIPLETELAKLDQEYAQICGAMTVQFQGRECTLPQMARFQEETDRSVREAAWRTVADRRLRDRAAIDAIYQRMVDLRQRVAANAGFANYRDYAHRAKRRFDYAPADCDAFARGVERHIVPALRRLHRQRAAALGVERLRPWDLAVDPLGRPPLRPFGTPAELVERTSRLFHRMDPQLGGLFDSLRGGGCLDLESRKGKAPGGYQSNRDRQRMPFIFMNAAGVQRDVETMVHEAGHAFHSLLSRADPLLAYRSDLPLEFAEVASMSMELTSYPYLDEFYGPADADRARRVHLEQLASMLPWIATIDQFQQWIYTHPGHGGAERTAAWLSVLDRFGGEVDWSGLDEVKSALWHRQLHLFGAPFYYIEYGIAQLGALQVWANFERDRSSALAAYKRGLTLGGSRPLPDLFNAAGIDLDLTPGRIERCWSQVERALAA
ncbi:MAG: M3 family oligoendopeptidase, partial [Phycisphaerae bacterium]|nr:M3 family oligoendopeptidase [Phycisphaerae bacterium]